MKHKIIISDGGSFRILFDSKIDAEKFREYLYEFYRRELGTTITIAEPVEVKSEQDAIRQAQVNLRRAKHRDKPPVSIEQTPYTAICASCGVRIARYYESRFPDEEENYVCEVCERKSEAREHVKENFLRKFLSFVSVGMTQGYDFPKKDADEVANLDPRNYIAYIIADGNNMGKIFGSCNNFDQLRKLSENLDTIINESLAEPTKVLLGKQRRHLQEREEGSVLIPVLPLILGGDDVFALLPARWSLDFTLRFSMEFEKRMKNFLTQIGLSDVSPTISAAVVICKGKFPYLVAHEIGEELLKTAKKRAKEEKSSTISFTVLTGSEIVKVPKEKRIFVAGFPAYTINELKKLIEYRFILKNLPGTRRAQFESLFLRAEELDSNEKEAFRLMKEEWIPERQSILNRLDKKLRNAVGRALVDLGNPQNDGNWLLIGGSYFHQFPDLLRVWDFAYNLERDVSEYEEVER
ncbi:MAG: hypothetical protein QXR19_11200 [Candidatus Jordarchaeaceae archaeon]